jgi:hypothetical protein
MRDTSDPKARCAISACFGFAVAGHGHFGRQIFESASCWVWRCTVFMVKPAENRARGHMKAVGKPVLRGALQTCRRGMYFRTVLGETRTASLRRSSFAIRSSTHETFSIAICRMSAWSSRGIGGRPGRDLQRQNNRNPARRHRVNVRGPTTTSASRQSNHRESMTINKIKQHGFSGRIGLAYSRGHHQSDIGAMGTPESSRSTSDSAAVLLNRRVRSRTHGGVGGRRG